MNQMLRTLVTTFSSRGNISFGAASAFLFGVAMYVPAHMTQTFYNMGAVAGLTELILLTVVAVLFGINIVLLIQRVRLAQSMNSSSVGSMSAASILGILFSGCTACGLTLASYVGLGSLGALLPWNGNEIKLLSILLLMYSIYTLSKPATCHFESKKMSA